MKEAILKVDLHGKSPPTENSGNGKTQGTEKKINGCLMLGWRIK